MNTTAEVTRAIKDLIGKDGIFGAKFIKADNSVRTGSFRLGVKKGLKGTEDGGPPYRDHAYNPEDQGLLVVFDMSKGGYRSMKLDRVIEISVRGVKLVRQEDGWYADGVKVG